MKEIIVDMATNAIPFCIVIAYFLTGIYLLISWSREDKEK